jgi:hypothetical protein
MNQMAMEKKADFTPEQMQLFKDLLEDSTEAVDNSFLPLIQFNREETIESLKRAKNEIDELLRVL